MADLKLQSKFKEILEAVAKKKNITNHEINIKVKEQTKNGFSGDFFFASITNRDTSEVLHLAIKCTFENMGDEALTALTDIAFINEMVFYDEVVPAFNKLQRKTGIKQQFTSIANCLCTQNDTKMKVLVFEDVSKQGFKMFNLVKSFKKDQLEVIFTEYAKFHALSFVIKKQNKDLYTKLTDNLIKSVYDTLYKSDDLVKMTRHSGKDILDCFDPEEDKEIYESVKKYEPDNIMNQVKEVFRYKGKYSCILHGDCWSNNMMFKFDSEENFKEIRIIDFQLSTEGSPAHDLTYCFYTGSTIEDQNKVNHYLELYHSVLSKFLLQFGETAEEIYPIEALKEDWKHKAKYGLLMSALLYKMKLMDQNLVPDFYKDNEETVLPTDLLMNASYDKDTYRKKIRDLAYHLYKINAL